MLNVVLTPGERKLFALADLLEKQTQYDQDHFFNFCGTPSCALGHWATAHPERWMKLVHNFTIRPVLKIFVPYPNPLTESQLCNLISDQHIVILSAQHEFDIVQDEYALLFSSWGCGQARTDNRKAASFIREFAQAKANARLKVG